MGGGGGGGSSHVEWLLKLKDETNRNSFKGALTLSGTGGAEGVCDSTAFSYSSG